MVECLVHDILSRELYADFIEDELDSVLSHLPSVKNLGQDSLTNEVLKQYSNILKEPLTLMLLFEVLKLMCWSY